MNAKTKKKATQTQVEITRDFERDLYTVVAIEDANERKEKYKAIVSALNKHGQANIQRTEEEKQAFDDAFKAQRQAKEHCQGVAPVGAEEEITDPDILRANEMFKLRIKSMGDNNKLQKDLRQDMLSQLGKKRSPGSKTYDVQVADYWHTASGKLLQEFNAQCIVNNSKAVKAYEKQEKAGKLNELEIQRLANLRTAIENSRVALKKSMERFGDLTK